MWYMMVIFYCNVVLLVFVELNFVDWIENDFEDMLIMYLLFLMN